MAWRIASVVASNPSTVSFAALPESCGRADDSQSMFCLAKYVAHQNLRALKCTVDVNFDGREAS